MELTGELANSRTKGPSVFLAQSKNRRFAGLGIEFDRSVEDQRSGS